MNKSRIPGSALFGLILIAIGVLSIASSLGYMNFWDMFSQYWPVIIILLGLKAIVEERSNTFFGLILTGIGSMLLVDNLGYYIIPGLDFHELIIPFIVIIIGINFMLPKGKNEEQPQPTVTPVTPTPPVPPVPPTPPTPPTPPVPPTPDVDEPEASDATEEAEGNEKAEGEETETVDEKDVTVE